MSLTQLTDDERTEELDSHVLRDTALINIQFWVRSDEGTT